MVDVIGRLKEFFGGHTEDGAANRRVAVSGPELEQWVTSGQRVLILDVRDQKAFRQGHIKGAVLIPLNELAKRLHELRSGQPIVVVGQTPAKARQAARYLRTQDFNAMILEGGIEAWPGRIVH